MTWSIYGWNVTECTPLWPANGRWLGIGTKDRTKVDLGVVRALAFIIAVLRSGRTCMHVNTVLSSWPTVNRSEQVPGECPAFFIILQICAEFALDATCYAMAFTRDRIAFKHRVYMCWMVRAICQMLGNVTGLTWHAYVIPIAVDCAMQAGGFGQMSSPILLLNLAAMSPKFVIPLLVQENQLDGNDFFEWTTSQVQAQFTTLAFVLVGLVWTRWKLASGRSEVGRLDAIVIGQPVHEAGPGFEEYVLEHGDMRPSSPSPQQSEDLCTDSSLYQTVLPGCVPDEHQSMTTMYESRKSDETTEGSSTLPDSCLTRDSYRDQDLVKDPSIAPADCIGAPLRTLVRSETVASVTSNTSAMALQVVAEEAQTEALQRAMRSIAEEAATKHLCHSKFDLGEDQSTYASSPSRCTDALQHMIDQLQGQWRISLEPGQALPLTWLQSFEIKEWQVFEGDGGSSELFSNGDNIWLQGGMLTVTNDVLFRRGKSGKVFCYRRP
mmetsp:Transcript_124508/g.278386  ORF Transcript_124508/g.278386 Transcript_124508/m.278386 type:complete len:494 (-) Transcript_124508:100-1581(-)